MSKQSAVIVLGILVILIPQLGVPSPWRTTLLVLTGFALVVIGFYLRAGAGQRTRGGTPTFIENTPQNRTDSTDDSHESRKEGINSLN